MDGFGGRRMNQRKNKRERVCDEKAKRICRSRGERRGDSNADYLHKTYSESKRENKSSRKMDILYHSSLMSAESEASCIFS